MYDTGVETVIVLTNHLAKQNDPESLWIENMERLLQKTDNIPLGIYECPLPYKRLVPVETMKWAAKTERIFWSKDTSEDINQIIDKLSVTLNSSLSLYNAHTASLYKSLKAGAFGFSGIAANFYPQLFSWLCKNFKDQPETALELQNFLTEGQKTVDHKYPHSAKQFMVMKGVISERVSRLGEQVFNPEEIKNLEILRDKANDWLRRLKLPLISE